MDAMCCISCLACLPFEMRPSLFCSITSLAEGRCELLLTCYASTADGLKDPRPDAVQSRSRTFSTEGQGRRSASDCPAAPSRSLGQATPA